jgi:hypothetical protein
VSWSRYASLRKRLAPFAFLGAIALLAHETCDKKDHRTATFVIDFGAADGRVRAVDATLYGDPVAVTPTADDVLGTLHRQALPGAHIGRAQFKAVMPVADGELRLEVDLGDEVRHVVKRVHTEQDATVTVFLANDLLPSPR